jgi:two-component system cell cycle sensor histidine kinase/response regulator CckA
MARGTENDVDPEQGKLVTDQNEVEHLKSQLAEQAKVLAELQTHEDRYRSILETTNAVAWELDVNSLQFTYISPQIEALSGYPPEKWTDFNFWASKIHSDERSDAVNWCQAETAKGLDHDIEYRMIRADGDTVWVRDVITVISEQETPVFLRGHFFNIDDRKKAEEASFALQATTYRSQKMESLGLMASGIAHDFNNLLTVILGNAELVLTMSDVDAPTAPFTTTSLLEDIQKAGRQAAELIHEMLTYVGKDPLELKDTDLNAIILDMWSLVERAHPKSVNLTHDLGQNLPTTMADPTLIQQVILNLIINASDAVGGKIGSITVRTSLVNSSRIKFDESFTNPLPASENCILVEVSDTGSGIDDAVAAKLFEPFYSTKMAGRGLGLATVLGIVIRHSGTISVKSKIGHGTTFSIYLPALEPHIQATTESEIVEKEVVYTKGMILVVDDEDGVRDMANRMLAHSGFSVLSASNGFEALELFEQHQHEIDCVLLDFRMPLMSGEETLERLRNIDGNVKVVLVSGNYDPDEAAKMNVNAFVQKPYSMVKIARTLSDAILEPVSLEGDN